MKALIIGLMLVALVGCTTMQEDVTTQMDLGQAVLNGVETTAPAPAVKEFEMRLIEEQFDPNTIIVNKGDNVRLVFLFTEPEFVSIDSYGIAEEVETNAIDFVADRTGTYEIVCHDCYKDFDRNDRDTQDWDKADEDDYTSKDLVSVLRVI